ncbi:hypothetical protein CWB96_01980 [Pseudoalteromonas citrea]|uniref:Carrier domain-containing protein n=1 Tax=Pseudoalteromonas citrea TaxID=43655 RepID=A0A5S3XWH3_9GAMM|nr:hypothetical protein [Pseudoalteromonas citrea]TMP43477.1 hypothetical protein CWB97_09540 [Pseudoalteromonas citrea]TMP62124.1 hypothetical protein CWB96_01980 [Pseudoalteromonas citrea]
MNREQLLLFFSEFLMARGIEHSQETLLHFNFVESGLLDSFEILSMIMELELISGVKLTPLQLVDESNATVSGLMSTLLESL